MSDTPPPESGPAPTPGASGWAPLPPAGGSPPGASGWEPLPPTGGPPLPPLPDPGAAGVPEPAPRKSSMRSWIIAGAVAGCLAIGAAVVISTTGGKSSASPVNASATSPGGAQAGPEGGFAGPGGAFRGRGTAGRITSVKGSTFVVQATDRSGATTTVTVDTDASTRYTDSVAGKVSDLHQGDHVVVMGQTTSAGVTAANVIDTGDQASAFGAGPPGGRRFAGPNGQSGQNGTAPNGAPGFRGRQRPGAGFGFAAGTVKRVDGSTFTVTTTAGDDVAVTTSSSTNVSVVKTISFGDLAVGDTVRVVGTTSNDTVQATSVQKGTLGFGFGRGGPFGGPPGGNLPGGGATSTQ